ncbi:hypothetical protein LY78DRAFT_272805 [Colletotrichum sublineola]|nr:hypothetical protein LY78DRAFT_272805 [Colletotrichum sublineola]
MMLMQSWPRPRVRESDSLPSCGSLQHESPSHPGPDTAGVPAEALEKHVPTPDRWVTAPRVQDTARLVVVRVHCFLGWCGCVCVSGCVRVWCGSSGCGGAESGRASSSSSSATPGRPVIHGQSKALSERGEEKKCCCARYEHQNDRVGFATGPTGVLF